MSYEFINENLKSVLSDNKLDVASLSFYLNSLDFSFLLNHNIEAIERILNFLNTPETNLFILNGFMGAGKTFVADFIMNFVSDGVLTFKNSYQEAINTDDVLLSLFKDFSNYHNEGKIHLPKIETNVFSDKINAYIKSCNKPMLFIFDSFEINMRSKESQKDILHFINYLTHFEKVKIIICSRSFKVDDLLDNTGVSSYLLTSLSKDDVQKYITDNEIQASNYEIESLFKMIRGHYLMLELSVLVMSLYDMSLNIFLNDYKKSTKNLLEFLISKILGVSSDKFLKLLLFLGSVRHGVSGEFLIFQNITNIETIEFLLQKKIIAEKFGKYYLKDYLKTEFLKGINPASKIKVHEYIINLYEAELPLKPFERGLFLSRQTMRQEIAFHSKRIDTLRDELMKTDKVKTPDSQDFNYVSYSKTSGFDQEVQKKKISVKQSLKSIKRSPKRKVIDKTNVDKLLMSMPKDTFANDIKEIEQISDVVVDIEPIQKVPCCLEDYLEIANNYQNAFNYTNAILYYKKALSYTEDISFNEKQPLIYVQLAICNKKLQDIDEAVAMYEKAYALYLHTSFVKANELLIDVARMYCELYKFDRAKEFYNRIIYSENKIMPETLIRVYLDLAELETNSSNMNLALSYSQKAMIVAEKHSDIKLLSECYFKHALLLDDTDNIEFAVKYYLRCVQTANNPEENKFLSSAYANLADISVYNKNISAAKMYYELSIDADKKQNNIDGLYHSYSRFSQLYKQDNPQKAYELLLNALAAAKKFDDLTYAIAIYIEIGDYYVGLKEFKKAIKSYILAKTLTPLHSEDDLNEKIVDRINKIKSFVGEKMFAQMIDEIKKKR